MKFLLAQSLAPTTRATYSSGVKAFLNFATLYNRLNHMGNPLPASQETLMLFAAYLTYSLAPASIKIYLYAVRSFHLEQGFPSPMDNAVDLQRLMPTEHQPMHDYQSPPTYSAASTNTSTYGTMTTASFGPQCYWPSSGFCGARKW